MSDANSGNSELIRQLWDDAQTARMALDYSDQEWVSNRLIQAAKALEECERYAAEGWGWVDDALKALGVETVFDIPKVSA